MQLWQIYDSLFSAELAGSHLCAIGQAISYKPVRIGCCVALWIEPAAERVPLLCTAEE